MCIADAEELDQPFDTVVATFVLSGRRDLDHVLSWVVDQLARRATCCSSTADQVVRRRWRSGPALHPRAREGFAPPADVPAAIRRAGCTVTTVERFGLSTLTLPLRSLVSGIARLAQPRRIRNAA